MMRYDKPIMEAVLNIYKLQGMTPLQAIDRVRKAYPEYRNEKMTYAGRLDPMAEGVLIILVGDAVHKKEEYVQLDKVYEANIVFGFGTDTHDLLGLPTVYDARAIGIERIKKELVGLKGICEYPFPAYSSKPINGKPLFQWAREGRLHEIEIPKRSMCVHDVKLLELCAISADMVRKTVTMMVKNVRGDFRQTEILHQWGVVLSGLMNKTAFPVVRLRVHCASGTYIRTLSHELGKRLSTDAVLMRLVRIRVGEFGVKDSIRLG